jgi:hypothetical protein
MRNALTMMVMHRPDSEAGATDLPERYLQWQRVFSEGEAATLPDDKMIHAIPLEPGKSLPYGPLYSLSQYKLKVLHKYLDKMLARGWIYQLTSPAGAPVLFVWKPDRSLCLCIDYRGLNAITPKNWYPLPCINKLMDHLVNTKFFTKLDLRDAYHHIRI